MSQHHVVSCTPEHCHWGFFDSGLKPVAAVASGDTVHIECVSGGPEVMPPDSRFEVLSDHRRIIENVTPKLGAHILTRPVAVEGAEPGDVLEIQTLSIDLRQNWGYTRIRPLAGTFRLILRKDLKFGLPRAETPTHHITMAFNEDLDDAAKDALREMIKLIGEKMKLPPDDAYMFASLAVDMRVTQLVDGNKGIHAMLPKRYAEPSRS